MNTAIMQEVIDKIKSDDSRDGAYPIRRLTGDNYDFIKCYTTGGDFQFFYDGMINGKRCELIYWGSPMASWMPSTNPDAYFDFEKRLLGVKDEDNPNKDLDEDDLKAALKIMFDDLKENNHDSRRSPLIEI